MKYDFDSYFLYEAIPRTPLTVKIKVSLSVPIDGEVLRSSAVKAFRRYRNYSRTVRVNEENAFVLEECDAPIVVCREGEPCKLGSKELNGLFFAITYTDDAIFFCFSHSFCGGCGAMPWIKTTLWQYLTDMGYSVPTDGIPLPDDEMSLEEMKLPDVDALPEGEPLGNFAFGDAFFPMEDFISYSKNPVGKDVYFPISIEKEHLMKYARANDGSPNSILSAVTFKACAKVFEGAEQISAKIACNYRADVGCPETYRDMVRLLRVRYKKGMENWPIDRLSTVTRGAMYLQMQPEFSWREYRRLASLRAGIDKQPTLEEKRKYAIEHSLLRGASKDTFAISYVGNVNWGGLGKYVTSLYTLTQGHLMLEVSAVENQFCISFMTVSQGERYLSAFLSALEEAGISYQAGETQARNLPTVCL